MGKTWLSVPKDWISSFGDIAKFSARVVADVFNGRVFHFFGEALRQAGILILGSALVIWGLAFILGLQCGIEGAYFSRAVGAPSNAGVFAAWCDLREIMPYAFGYMMSAKVGTGLVAVIVVVGCYYGYTAGGGPVGVGTATAKSMVFNTVLVHLVGMVGTQIFWGTNPRAPIGGGGGALPARRPPRA